MQCGVHCRSERRCEPLRAVCLVVGWVPGYPAATHLGACARFEGRETVAWLALEGVEGTDRVSVTGDGCLSRRCLSDSSVG